MIYMSGRIQHTASITGENRYMRGHSVTLSENSGLLLGTLSIDQTSLYVSGTTVPWLIIFHRWPRVHRLEPRLIPRHAQKHFKTTIKNVQNLLVKQTKISLKFSDVLPADATSLKHFCSLTDLGTNISQLLNYGFSH